MRLSILAKSRGCRCFEYFDPTGIVDLRFSKSGDPGIEKSYRTHYVSPALSEVKQQRIAKKLSSADPPAVLLILRDSQCSECSAEIEQGSLLLMEAGVPLCLPCARLGDLEYLPPGDAGTDAARR